MTTIEATLSPAELAEWHTAVTEAKAEGTFFYRYTDHSGRGWIVTAQQVQRTLDRIPE